jgi:hypothetical protein
MSASFLTHAETGITIQFGYDNPVQNYFINVWGDYHNEDYPSIALHDSVSLDKLIKLAATHGFDIEASRNHLIAEKVNEQKPLTPLQQRVATIFGDDDIRQLVDYYRDLEN